MLQHERCWYEYMWKDLLLAMLRSAYGQFYAITFWPKIKIEKNVKIYQNTLSRDYLCKKIVKGGW